jgi:hypothetical protein
LVLFQKTVYALSDFIRDVAAHFAQFLSFSYVFCRFQSASQRAGRQAAIFLNPLPPKGELAQRLAPPLLLRAVYNDFGRIELTAEQLASMGATVQPNQSSEEIDVTEFVRLGKLTIR